MELYPVELVALEHEYRRRWAQSCRRGLEALGRPYYRHPPWLMALSQGRRMQIAHYNWRLLVELGQSCGWTPLGTTRRKDAPVHCRRYALDYQVDLAECAKRVSAADAAQWAEALERAVRGTGDASQQLAWASTQARVQTDERYPTPESIVHTLIDFLRGGAFEFFCTD